MLKRLHISNYKSIYDETIELGRFNVFIGENGSGKTNVLEALGMASAASENKLSNDELALKGIRVAKPTITFSSFLGEKQKKEIVIEYDELLDDKLLEFTNKFTCVNANDIFSTWNLNHEYSKKLKHLNINNEIEFIQTKLTEISENIMNMTIDIRSNKKELEKYLDNLVKWQAKTFELKQKKKVLNNFFDKQEELITYKIYNLSTQTLRGIGGISRAIPGIQGENLDRLIESFDKEEREKLEAYAYFISWLDKIEIDKDDRNKLNGHKLDMSTSILYFRDKYMQKKNNLFSAENANEGVLHILFYLSLFISKHTSKLFAIDNIETALNPELCRNLVEKLAVLSKEHEKQVLITTHSPAALDGLNLHDDEQRLFKVYRNNKGHTKVKRIQLKPNAEVNGQRLKLSELWMRGYIGAIPKNL